MAYGIVFACIREESQTGKFCNHEGDQDNFALHVAIEQKGTALMQMKGKRAMQRYPQSAGNLALADESLGTFDTAKAMTHSPRLRLLPGLTEAESEIEALAPATGIINGIRLSMPLWYLIVLVMLLIH